jgi:NAD(P)H-flavin reductase
VRGPYGAEAPPAAHSRVVVLAGGTGIAVAAPLAKSLAEGKRELRLYFGASRRAETDLAALLCPGLFPRAVADDGIPARVLERVNRELGRGGGSGCTFYAVGPEGFLERAARAAEALGADPRQIFLCLETPSLCGIGLCGSCECAGRLLCKEGTFLSLETLRSAEAVPRREREVRTPSPVPDRYRIAPPQGRERREPFVPAAASGSGS